MRGGLPARQLARPPGEMATAEQWVAGAPIIGDPLYPQVCAPDDPRWESGLRLRAEALATPEGEIDLGG